MEDAWWILLMANLNIFTFLNQIFYKKETHSYDKKLAPAYLLSLWLSHDKNIINIVNEINRLQFRLSDDIIYKYYLHKIPKGRRFIKWTKKEKQGKKEKQNIEDIKSTYNVSNKEAKRIMEIQNKLQGR